MHCILLTGVAVLCLALPHLVHAQSLPPDVLITECRDRFFWIWGNKSFFVPGQWSLYALNDTRFPDPMQEPQRAAQCGYTFTTDLRGNMETRISFLGCWVKNTNDQRFDISLELKVNYRGQTSTYPVVMTCRPQQSWDVREIVCEENYMEVSVSRIIPAAIVKSLQLSGPVAGISQAWKVSFTNSSTGTILAKDAIGRGYGVNATVTRVVFRASYNTAESQIIMIGNYHLEVITSMMMYKQTLLSLFVDTTLACPRDPPVFTDLAVSWRSPSVLSPLLTGSFLNSGFTMGVNGNLIANDDLKATKYMFQYSGSTVEVTVPIGAPEGYLQSDIVDNTYVTIYSINLMLQRQWTGENDDDSTTHLQYKPVVTPAIRQIPIFIDHTIKEQGYFNVSLGNFYSDVVLNSFTIHKAPLTLNALTLRGMDVAYATNPNNTQVFYLIVPFKDSLVEMTYLGNYSRRYKLYVTYVMTLEPKGKNFTYSNVVDRILEDAAPPNYTNSCGRDRLVINMTRGNIGRYWLPYIRNLPLTNELITSQKYVVRDTDVGLYLEVPYPSVGLIYEVATLDFFRVRLDFSLRNNRTLNIESSTFVICIFPPVPLVCIANGSIIAVVNSSLSKPSIDPTRTHLKDINCKPQEVGNGLALFNFAAYTCGTTKKFDSDYLVYENEVIYDRAVLFPDEPIISRDSTYRMTLRCRYPVKDTLMLAAQNKSALPMLGLAVPDQAKVLRRRARTHMAELRIAKDDAYSAFYQPKDFPVSVPQSGNLYIQADMPSTNLVTLLQDCWATAFPNHDGQAGRDLVVDGCSTTGPDLSSTINISSDYSSRLHVKLNGDVIGQVYIHCKVALCDPSHTDGCFQTCNQTQERVFTKRSKTFSEVVSAGPVNVTSDDGEISYRHIGVTSWSTWNWVLSIGLGVIAALTVGAIFLAVRLFAH
ncbi:uncharacterized protein [Pyxicephalus adspersus]|uniref:uncharacterized protein isoform X2 n=1 Tax=Pyxicephalus adspersus TaxID=30357 RepID=UPI003B5B22A1